jgi:hypothetical protein
VTRVSVEIIRVATQPEPPATRLTYRVRSHGDAPIWLVNDEWLIWHQDGSRIELSFARGRLQPGTHPFGYFDPTVTLLEPGAELTQEVVLRWPLALDRLWNTTSVASPTPGEYQVVVRVGYGLRPESEAPVLGESVEDPVLHWQQEAVSPAATMHIPPYPRADRGPV